MEDFKDMAKALGSRGGAKTKERYGSDYYRELQRKGVEAKLKKKKQG